ncbi:M57 family metalloprotease [uncultured Aquimarina sp.]|uniref:M57 family metalloprotease n=1 Tax=uncultured Aquimarina sp. TaxID=575652 RepID=UPI00260F9D2B|nr:M57 family metalloprotease [uncultured Aquimarina sp.]
MKFLKLTFIIAIAFSFTQCEQENEIVDSSDATIVDNTTLEKIAKLGFDTQNYPVLKDGEYYTVEGDINIPESYLDEIDNQNQSKQRRWVNIVSCNEIRYITVFNNLPAGSARNSVSLAMRHWNDITKCDIRFAATSNINNAEVIISNGPLSQGVVGRGTFPSNGKPGRYIRLDLNQFSSYSYAQWRSTIEHELGHNIGFAHTNGSAQGGGPLPQEILIQGTPVNDPNSLMNGRRGGTVRSLTGDDKRAARLLYNTNFSGRLCN